MQLLLVDNRVKDVQTVTQSLLPSVDYVLVDFETDTYETLVAKIPVKTYDSVGIFEENYELTTYQLVNSFTNSVLTNVETEDPSLETWSQYKSLLSYFKNTLQVNTLDLMGCNINSNPNWNYVIDYLGKQFQINIHSSNDNTGSPDFGGNWILESGNQDLIGKYFSNNINKYQFVLGPASNSSYVIATDNKLYGCGSNNNSTMNDADILSTVIFTQIPDVTNISKLYVGPNSTSSFVIKTDGSLWATGLNSSGQLGTGTYTNLSVFTKVYTPSGGVTCTAVSCGLNHTQILLSDGSVWATGSNGSGQYGTGNYTSFSVFTQVYTPSEGVTCTSVSCGQAYTHILLSDGSVRAAGTNGSGQLGTTDTISLSIFTTVYTPSEGLTCTAVSCGTNHTQILLSDGSVRATGQNGYGQLGTTDTTNISVFTPVYTPSGGVTCTAVSCGSSHTHILLSDGSVRATGANFSGHLGTTNRTQQNSFVSVYTPSGGITCTAVSCGSSQTHILLSNGSVRATGNNGSGRLGTGDTTNKNSFTTVYTPSGGVTCTAVSGGLEFTHILLSDGSVRATGLNSSGQLGIQNGKNINLLRDLNINVNYISTGSGHIAVIKSDGSVWTKGSNGNGQLGTGNTTNVTIFTKVYTPSGGVTCTAVSCGSSHTQILLSDGSVRATGSNSSGQLGNGNITQQNSFTTVYTPSDGVTCTAVSCGSFHTHILLSDGSVSATGNNGSGQLGTGDTINTYSFTTVYTPSDGVTCKAVSCGGSHTQILLSDGSVWATGLNSSGQLGTTDTTNITVFTPVYTQSEGVICRAVACGSVFTQILLSDGSVRATGSNFFGQLGYGNTTNISVFTPVYTPSEGVTCTAVSCGSNHTQILLSDGSVRATGENGSGQLGNGNYTQQNSFVAMLKSDGTTMVNVFLLPEIVPPPPLSPIPSAPTISSVNGTSTTRESPTVSISFTQSPADSTITNYSYSTNGTTYTVLNPVQTSGPLIIPASGLASGTSYTFRIKAINSAGTSSESIGFSSYFYIPPAVPTIASVNSVSVTRVNPTVSITVSNPADSTITNYSYSTDGITYTVLNPSQISGVLTIPASGLESGTSYTFRIKAINTAGTSDQSTGFSSYFYMPPAVPTISSVNSVSITRVNPTVSITVSNPSDSTITNYSYSTDGITYTVLNPAQISGVLTIPASGLTSGASYTFRIKATNTAGTSETSIGFSSYFYMPPAVPTISSVNSVSITRVNPTVSITVSNPSDSTITNYSYSTDGITYTVLNPAQISGVLTIPASGLTSGASYTFRIKAINIAGTSETSAGFSSFFYMPPQAPTIASVNGTSTTRVNPTVSITFTNPSDSTITNYSYSTNGTTYTVLNPSQISGVLTIPASGLASGTSYTFQIKAINTAGTSSESIGVSSYFYMPPAVPTIDSINSVSVTRVNPTVSITVSDPSDSSITNYSWSTDGINYIDLNPAQISGPLTIPASGLVSGTNYIFQIKAINTAGTSETSAGVSSYFYMPPAVPTIASVNGTSTTRVNPTVSIAFTNPSDPTITNYSWSTDGITYTDLSPVKTTSPLTIPASGLISGTNYTFQIKATNTAGTSETSSGFSSYFYMPPVVPTIVSVNSVSATRTNPTVSITLEDPSDSTITNYSYSTNGTTYTVLSPPQPSGPLTIPATGLISGTNYTFQIKAINSSGSSDTSTGLSSYFYMPPAVPTIVSVNSVSVTRVNPTVSITLEDPSDTTITNYSYSTNGITYTVLSPAQPSGPLTIPATGLTSGTNYTFQIKAINAAGTTNASTGFSSYFYMPPVVPTIVSVNSVSVTRVNPTVSITFANPSDPTITNYSYSTNGISYTVLSPAQTSGPLTIPASGLVSGTSYTFQIKAINAAGTTTASDGFSSYFYMPPQAPTIASINSFSTSRVNPTVSITVSNPTDTTITNYYYSINGVTPYIELTSFNPITPLTLTIPVTGLTSGTSYTFQIKAINTAGTSSASTGISSIFYKPPDVPTIASINSISLTRVNPTVSITVSNPSDTTITSYSYSINGAAFVTLNTTGPLIIPASGLTNGTRYSFQIKAINAAGTSIASAGVLSTFTMPPSIPTVLIVNGTSSTRVNPTVSITLSDPSDPSITNYSYSINGNSFVTLSPEQKGTSLIIPANGLTSGTSYTFQFKAINVSGISDATIGVPSFFLMPPAALTISNINSVSTSRVSPTVSITFTNPSDPSITNYSYSINGKAFIRLTPQQISSGVLTIPATGLAIGSNNTFQIKAINNAGSSDTSAGFSSIFYMPSAAPIISSVSGILATRVNPTVLIALANSSDTSITNYSYSTDGTNYTELSPAQPTGPLTIPATGLTSGSNYTFQIKSINTAGTSSASTGVSAKITMPPADPIISSIDSVLVTRVKPTVSINVTDPSDTTITNYSYSTNGASFIPSRPLKTSGPLIVAATRFQNGSNNTFQIKAINPAGTSNASTGVSSIFYIPPSAPRISRVNANSLTRVNPTVSINVANPNPADTTITNYAYSTDGTNYTELSPAQSSRPLIIPATGLVSGSRYTFQIKAINTAGTSSASIGVSAKFTMPQELKITDITTEDGVTSISFTQNPSGSIITNYAYSTSSIINTNNTFTIGSFSSYTLLSPAQTSSPLTINGLDGVVKIKIKALYDNNSYSDESNSVINWYEKR